MGKKHPNFYTFGVLGVFFDTWFSSVSFKILLVLTKLIPNEIISYVPNLTNHKLLIDISLILLIRSRRSVSILMYVRYAPDVRLTSSVSQVCVATNTFIRVQTFLGFCLYSSILFSSSFSDSEQRPCLKYRENGRGLPN